MKRKIWLACFVLLVGLVLASCQYFPGWEPAGPQEVLSYCQEFYENIKVDYPDTPHAFIGYCVASIQSGKEVAGEGLCNYEEFRDLISEGMTKKECLEYFHTAE